MLHVGNVLRHIKSMCKLSNIVHDIKLLREVRTREDAEALQRNPSRLGKWMSLWQNMGQCKVLHIGAKNS